jgi:hypothetical protein
MKVASPVGGKQTWNNKSTRHPGFVNKSIVAQFDRRSSITVLPRIAAAAN